MYFVFYRGFFLFPKIKESKTLKTKEIYVLSAVMKILILLKFGKQIFKLVKHIFLLFFKKTKRIMPTGIEKKS